MAATKHPDVALPTDAPVTTKEWIGPFAGDSTTGEWQGTPADIDAKYAELVAEGEAGGNIAGLSYRNDKGRCTLVARYGRGSTTIVGVPENVTVIEELYAVDIIKDIREAPYYCLGGTAALTDERAAWVYKCARNGWTQAEITANAIKAGLDATPFQYANFTAPMLSLFGHLTHGVESYYETGFILRRSQYGIKTSAIQAAFTNINRVVASPGFISEMTALLQSLPAGEWIYRPPQAEHLGKGRWRVTQEWMYSPKWSVVYGGTWTGLNS
jgi:hypothetical protein